MSPQRYRIEIIRIFLIEFGSQIVHVKKANDKQIIKYFAVPYEYFLCRYVERKSFKT